MASDPGLLRALARAECVSLLSKGGVGRIGITVGGLPVILPVNFAVLDDETVVFRTVTGTKLAAATRGAVVAFEVDDFEADGSQGWSVLVRGVASEVTEADLVERIQHLPLQAWAVGASADHIVGISMVDVTGRRFGSPDAGPA